jgi:hypothetical protein
MANMKEAEVNGIKETDKDQISLHIPMGKNIPSLGLLFL